jgi:hypothetical protein
VSTLFTVTQHSAGTLDQSNKRGERNPRGSNREGRSQIVPICRYDPIPERHLKLNHKTLRAHKHFQQSSRIQNQYTKISSISVHHEQSEKEIRKIISFTIASKN